MSEIVIQTTKGPHSVKAVKIGPSLAVHRGYLGMDWWVITHIPTGMNFNSADCIFRRKKDAVAAAKEVAALTDWNAGVPALRELRLKAAVQSIAERYHGEAA